jgi:hypothetical protein
MKEDALESTHLGLIKSFRFWQEFNDTINGNGVKFYFSLVDLETEFWFSGNCSQARQWIKTVVFCYREKEILSFSYKHHTKEVVSFFTT